MKRYIYVTVIFLIAMKSYSQNSKFSIDFNYPILMDNYFIGENYNGIIDIGLDYTFESANTMNLGLSFNTSILQNNANKNIGNQFKVTSYVFQPKLMLVGNSVLLGGFSPSVGIGYSFFLFDITGSSNGFSDAAGDTQSGFNLNLGLAYDLSDKFFTQVQYDFFKTSVSDGVPKIKYNTNINLLKIGLGYNF